MIRGYFRFLKEAYFLSFTGGKLYYAWMTVLTIIAAIGAREFMKQTVAGFTITDMTDQVSWGIYIANFTFLVGLAAAAVMLVIPAYIYRNKEMRDVVLFGELLAIASIVMCLLFIMVDLGRPDRFWHMIPGLGKFNFPYSMLSWDFIVLWGYLLINLHICGYLLYTKYLGTHPTFLFYMPFVIISIVWAVSIHTVTAFLYVGLVGRPYWNTAIVAPRFLVSAFTAGPCILILAFQIIHRFANFRISERAVFLLRNIVTASLLINLFLLACEMFKEFYAMTAHSTSASYLFFGIEHHGKHYDALTPWIWTAIAMESVAAIILVIPPVARKAAALNVACVLAVLGIWVEKGMGLVIPGFIPSPQGTIIEYTPSLTETLVSLGIWAFGILMFSWMLHLAIPIMTGEFHVSEEKEEKGVEWEAATRSPASS
jgi:molybdopterin-containing oxidoreductase family membrane subunit